MVAGDGQEPAFPSSGQARGRTEEGRAPVPLFPRYRARTLCRRRIAPLRHAAVRRQIVAAVRSPGRRRSARRRGHRRDRGHAQGAAQMTDWLADTLLATSLLMALVLLVREPVRRHFGPAAAYGLWLIPALRLAMPPLTWTVERTVPAANPLAPGASQTTQPSVMPVAEPGLVEQLGGWETLAVSAWLAGASAMLIRGFLLYRRQRREVLRDSVPVARLGKIRIVRSEAVRGPLAFGIIDRVIALPIDFDERYDPLERRLALDHELAHHRSGDLAVNHFAFVFLCLQWFNPLAWVSHSAFRFDQEAACDARVLDKVNGQNRAAYAQAITKAASGQTLLFAGALDRPGTLQRRLKS